MKTQFYTLVISCCILIAVFLSEIVNAQILNYTGFEDFEDEEIFTYSSWISEGFNVPWVNGFNNERGHVDDEFAIYGTNSLRIYYPANTYGPQSNGAQAPLKVLMEEELYMSYWVRFSDNFDWGGNYEGGKLPGLGTGALCSGCSICTGSNGFTARLMWREGGRGVLYLYHIEEDKLNPPCGSNFQLQLAGSDFYFETGEWYNIIQRVKINTESNHDGEVEIWINQQPALLLTELQFVNNGIEVNTLYFSTFHGGGSSEWAPSVDCYTWFDNIVIASEAEDVFDFTSISDNNLPNNITAYPNPVKANSTLRLNFGKQASYPYQIEWITFSGKTVFREDLNAGSSTLLVPALSPGVYTLKLSGDESISYKKIIVN